MWTKDGKATERLVAKAVKMSSDLHETLNVACKSIAYQMLVHKNATPAINLFVGLDGSSIYLKSFVDWLEANVKAKLVQDKDTKAVKPSWSKDYKQLDDATATEAIDKMPPFWKQFKVPSAFKGFDYDEELAKLNKKAFEMARAAKQGTIKKGKEIIELTPGEIASINLGSFLKTVKQEEQAWN